jgi:hypothetical protein
MPWGPNCARDSSLGPLPKTFRVRIQVSNDYGTTMTANVQ